MNCRDDEHCMHTCFDYNADGSPGACVALYDDHFNDWGGGSDPCDECIMACDSIIDWWSETVSEDTWVEYETCTDACYDSQHGECGGVWSDATDLHPCDACLIGCHEGGGDEWLDEQIALGRPFCPCGISPAAASLDGAPAFRA